jgi:hypothetical protein
MMDYVFKENDIAWLNMWLLLMISIYVKTMRVVGMVIKMLKEEFCELLQIPVD